MPRKENQSVGLEEAHLLIFDEDREGKFFNSSSGSHSSYGFCLVN